MKTKILTTAGDAASAMHDLLAWADKIDFAYAWMSSDRGRSPLWHALDETKVQRGVIGLHFAGTEPQCLDYFRRATPTTVRVIEDATGTFHPKVILGRKGASRRAIVGSSNFTPGGFAKNSEMNVLLSGQSKDLAFSDIEQAIAGYWFRAAEISMAWLREYRATWNQRPQPPKLKLPAKSVPTVSCSADLDVPWSQYYERIRAQALRGISVYSEDPQEATYLSETRRAHLALRGDRRFAELSPDEARVVAGFGPDTGYYGSTRANGAFMSLVKERPEAIGRIIDAVSLEGEVDNSAVRAAFQAAKKLRRVGTGCVTRLLCMKRPDLFFSVNGPNRARMKDVFGFAPEDASTYLKLRDIIHELEWCRSPRPQDPIEREVWAARVGLLDAILYDPDAR